LPRVLRLEARDEQRLSAVSGEIHDWFFDLEDVTLDAERRELIVPFRRWEANEAHRVHDSRVRDRVLRRTTWEAPWYRWYLRVFDAKSYEITDQAQIPEVDFNAVVYDAISKRPTIHGNTPVRIDVTVQELHVAVEQTADRLGLARYTTWVGGTSYSGEVLSRH
jgi:hypothetical protein